MDQLVELGYLEESEGKYVEGASWPADEDGIAAMATALTSEVTGAFQDLVNSAGLDLDTAALAFATALVGAEAAAH